MFMVIVIAALAAVGIVGSLVALPRDGYRPIPTDPARLRLLQARSTRS